MLSLKALMVVADACEQGRREGRARGWRGRAALGVGIATRVRACGAEHIGGYPQMVDLDNDLLLAAVHVVWNLDFDPVHPLQQLGAERSFIKLFASFTVHACHARSGCATAGWAARAWGCVHAR